jgi:hypothetical protein
MPKQVSNWFCTRCRKVMSDYREVGYDGPLHPERPVNDASNAAWQVLCRRCAKETGRVK